MVVGGGREVSDLDLHRGLRCGPGKGEPSKVGTEVHVC